MCMIGKKKIRRRRNPGTCPQSEKGIFKNGKIRMKTIRGAGGSERQLRKV